jgi:hypothetical protein
MMTATRNDAFNYPAKCTLCMIALDEKTVYHINDTCQTHFGPLFKYAASIVYNASDGFAIYRAKLKTL